MRPAMLITGFANRSWAAPLGGSHILASFRSYVINSSYVLNEAEDSMFVFVGEVHVLNDSAIIK
jgi:hypothetical protein